jgi:hypothetical protein
MWQSAHTANRAAQDAKEQLLQAQHQLHQLQLQQQWQSRPPPALSGFGLHSGSDQHSVYMAHTTGLQQMPPGWAAAAAGCGGGLAAEPSRRDYGGVAASVDSAGWAAAAARQQQQQWSWPPSEGATELRASLPSSSLGPQSATASPCKAPPGGHRPSPEKQQQQQAWSPPLARGDGGLSAERSAAAVLQGAAAAQAAAHEQQQQRPHPSSLAPERSEQWHKQPQCATQQQSQQPPHQQQRPGSRAAGPAAAVVADSALVAASAAQLGFAGASTALSREHMSVVEVMAATKQLEEQLLSLLSERDELDKELAKLPLGAGRTIRERQRKNMIQARLDELNPDISRVRTHIKRLNGDINVRR